MPLTELAGAAARGRRQRAPQYEFLPSAASILEEVVPASFKVRLFKCFLDAAVSEQIARMVAMKAATENADAMIGSLSMAYNRARQAQITSELLEVVGGAEARRIKRLQECKMKIAKCKMRKQMQGANTERQYRVALTRSTT